MLILGGWSLINTLRGFFIEDIFTRNLQVHSFADSFQQETVRLVMARNDHKSKLHFRLLDAH
jgi:hypothetical protein